MGKNINFSGQPVINQFIKFIDKSEVRKIAKKHGAERYVKKFSTYNHVVVMLFVALEGYHSIREVILSPRPPEVCLPNGGSIPVSYQQSFSWRNTHLQQHTG